MSYSVSPVSRTGCLNIEHFMSLVVGLQASAGRGFSPPTCIVFVLYRYCICIVPVLYFRVCEVVMVIVFYGWRGMLAFVALVCAGSCESAVSPWRLLTVCSFG
jgi:hypothetical protein